MQEEPEVYGPSLWVFFVGLLFAIPAACLVLFILYHLVSGAPLLWMKPPGSTSPQPAGKGDLMFFMSIPMIFFLTGLIFILFWKNWRVWLYSDGLIFRNWLGKERFRAKFDEITKITAGMDGGATNILLTFDMNFRGTGPYFMIYKGKRWIMISSYIRRQSELVTEVCQRSQVRMNG